MKILNTINKIRLLGLLIIAGTNSMYATNVTIDPKPGVIPKVSDHYKAMPSFYDFDQTPAEHISKNIERRFIMGAQGSVVRWDLKAGTKLPVHFHINEQFTYVKNGILEVNSQGQKYEVKNGQFMIFPPNVPHEFIAQKDTVILEFHTPGRQDFINGEFEAKLNSNPTLKSTNQSKQ